MAHEMETMFSARKVIPWHGLGVVINDCPTSADAIIQAGLDWQVELRNMFIPFEDGQAVEVSDKFAVVRKTDRKYLGVVGERYEPIQNSEMFSIMDSLVKAGEGAVTYETAGSLKGGKVVWMLANMGEMQVKGFDPITSWMLCSSSHDGSKTLRIIPTTTRVVCWNTLTLATNISKRNGNRTQEVRIRHTKNASISLEQSRKVLGVVSKAHADFKEEANHLASRQLKTKDFHSMLDILFPSTSTKDEKGDLIQVVSKINTTKRERIEELFANGAGNSDSRVAGTMWAGLNAVTEYFTWENGRKKNEISQSRVFKNWFGDSVNATEQVREFLLSVG